MKNQLPVSAFLNKKSKLLKNEGMMKGRCHYVEEKKKKNDCNDQENKLELHFKNSIAVPTSS